jgi:hypothetical protein
MDRYAFTVHLKLLKLEYLPDKPLITLNLHELSLEVSVDQLLQFHKFLARYYRRLLLQLNIMSDPFDHVNQKLPL